MGFHDAIRSLSDLGDRIYIYGSIMLPYFCQEQWEPPIDFCKTSCVNPINYAYPMMWFPGRGNVGIPAGMPFYYRINRGRKTHCIGDAAYNAIIGDEGKVLYKKNWNSKGAGFTFSDYHNALPNYLKYEVAPE